MTHAAFNNKKVLFITKLDLNLKKTLAYLLYGDETWTLTKVDQKYLESSEMWCWRRLEKII